MNRMENTREHNPLWIATFAAFIARGWGTRDALVATDRAMEMIRSADAAGDRITATAGRRAPSTAGIGGTANRPPGRDPGTIDDVYGTRVAGFPEVSA